MSSSFAFPAALNPIKSQPLTGEMTRESESHELEGFSGLLADKMNQYESEDLASQYGERAPTENADLAAPKFSATQLEGLRELAALVDRAHQHVEAARDGAVGAADPGSGADIMRSITNQLAAVQTAFDETPIANMVKALRSAVMKLEDAQLLSKDVPAAATEAIRQLSGFLRDIGIEAAPPSDGFGDLPPIAISTSQSAPAKVSRVESEKSATLAASTRGAASSLPTSGAGKASADVPIVPQDADPPGIPQTHASGFPKAILPPQTMPIDPQNARIQESTSGDILLKHAMANGGNTVDLAGKPATTALSGSQPIAAMEIGKVGTVEPGTQPAQNMTAYANSTDAGATANPGNTVDLAGKPATTALSGSQPIAAMEIGKVGIAEPGTQPFQNMTAYANSADARAAAAFDPVSAQTGGSPTPAFAFARSIAAQIRGKTVEDGRTRIELTPRGLGDIEIEVARDDFGKHRIVLRAENPAVLTAFRNDRELILNVLRDSGLSIESGDLDFEGFERQTSSGDSERERRTFSARSLEASLLEPATGSPVDAPHLAASDHALNIVT